MSYKIEKYDVKPEMFKELNFKQDFWSILLRQREKNFLFVIIYTYIIFVHTFFSLFCISLS